MRLGSPRDAMTGATASRTSERAPVVVTARAATSGPPIVAPIVAPIVTMIVTMIAAMVATMTAPTAAWAAACSHDLIELHAERRASVREQLARARPVLATIEFIPRPAAAAPGEHLRMLRVARADARAPQARAELELAYA
ncbi:MAG: hypothetical protein KC468_30620, partial [Myxococcales bacterium]|nr:hypothetical protein [Myxococcales bacterium]